MDNDAHGPPSPVVLNAVALTQAYGRRRVLKNLNLELKAGELAVLVGRNGSGKTTLLKVLARLLNPLSGHIHDGSGFSGTSLFLPEGFLYEDLTLAENLSLYAKLLDAPPLRRKGIADQLDLEPFLNQRVRSLSRGQKARGALCRALMPDVSAYLLDEPFAPLDGPSVAKLASVLSRLKRQGKTILIASHQIEPLKGIADRWYRMAGGGVVLLSGSACDQAREVS